MSSITATEHGTYTGTWAVDTTHSTLEFLVIDTYSNYTAIRGRFTQFDGTVEIGPDLDTTNIRAVIYAPSLTTDNEQRDAHLRSPDFLNVDAYPQIRFEAESVDSDDAGHKVQGSLTVQGKAQPLDLDVVVRGQGQDPNGAERAVLSLEGSMPFGPMTVGISGHVSVVRS